MNAEEAEDAIKSSNLGVSPPFAPPSRSGIGRQVNTELFHECLSRGSILVRKLSEQ